jgi:hypothetical protein
MTVLEAIEVGNDCIKESIPSKVYQLSAFGSIKTALVEGTTDLVDSSALKSLFLRCSFESAYLSAPKAFKFIAWRTFAI